MAEECHILAVQIFHMLIAVLLSLVLFGLGFLHLTWFMGGTYGYHESIPARADGSPLFRPKKIHIAIVSKVLSTFAIFYLVLVGIVPIDIPAKLSQYLVWIIPILFLLRAIGDRRYFGFFKKIKNTDFAEIDTKIYAPLSLAIGVAGIILAIQTTI